MNISKRLYQVYKYIDGQNFIDIGTDHGYLPIYSVLNSSISHVIASDVAKMPLSNVKMNVQHLGLEDIIEVKLSNGLLDIDIPSNIKTVSLNGMGGKLIRNIILESYDKIINEIQTLILQPNNNSAELRYILEKLGFSIVSEEIIYENKKYYEIIKASKNSDLEIQKPPFISVYDLKDIEKIRIYEKGSFEISNELYKSKLEQELKHYKKIYDMNVTGRNKEDMNVLFDKIKRIETTLEIR